MPKDFIESLLIIKRTAASVNIDLKLIPETIGTSIIEVCDELLADENLMRHFPVDIFQTGSGTSTNMNANEVIANLANKKSSIELSGTRVHPIDHVNFGQSSNDVIPTCIHVSAMLQLTNTLLPAMNHLIDSVETKAAQLSDVCKTGRTHLMDAMPVTFEQSLMAWSAQLKVSKKGILQSQQNIQYLAQGGTAVGTGVNAHSLFAEKFCHELSRYTNIRFKAGDCDDSNFFH
jgi:fumarase (EC 4.2.1.2)